MGNGVSLHIGLNAVDPAHYDGWSGPLNACEADVDAMQAICSHQGFASEVLKTSSATREAVLDRLTQLAESMRAGDTLVVSYSGHGGQIPDENSDEDDSLDETWCLFDGELLDDELYDVWGRFEPGVRIAVFSDSCHSGSVIKNMQYTAGLFSVGTLQDSLARYRIIPPEIQLRTYKANSEFYRQLGTRLAPPDPRCTVVLISGCQDNQLSRDGNYNGAFTAALMRVWNNGAFKGGYKAFAKSIRAKMPSDQSPQFMSAGAPNSAFADGQVFSLEELQPFNKQKADESGQLYDLANGALKQTLFQKRPNFSGNWMTAVPSKLDLPFDVAAWMGFVGHTLGIYSAAINPRHTGIAQAFVSFREKQLVEFRDALVENTR